MAANDDNSKMYKMRLDGENKYLDQQNKIFSPLQSIASLALLLLEILFLLGISKKQHGIIIK